MILQVGTRNAQKFELLKVVGQQERFPVLFKRGMGITLEEALNAREYIANEGNPCIITLIVAPSMATTSGGWEVGSDRGMSFC